MFFLGSKNNQTYLVPSLIFAGKSGAYKSKAPYETLL
jgi:hypothetical protein